MNAKSEMMSKRKELEELLAADSLDEHRLGVLLDTLASTEVHLDVLKKTKIGRTLNDARKKVRHTPSLSKKTAEIIHKWKKIATEEFLVERKGSESPKKSTPTSSDAEGATANIQDEDHEEDEHEEHEHKEHEEEEREEVTERRPSGESTDDDHSSNSSTKEKDEATVRQKSVELIEEALRSHDSIAVTPDADPHEIAEQVEHSIFDEFKDVKSSHYRAKVRSRVANLSDALNANLRELVLSGIISPHKLAEMTAEELANDHMRKIRKTLTSELKDEHLKPDSPDAHSTMFSCPECHERDSMYRNSLECPTGEGGPIEVTLLACNKCGNHWKNF